MTTTTQFSPRLIPTPNVGNLTAVQIATTNNGRQQLYVFNPGSNTIWVAPTLDNTCPGNATVAIAGGAGSVAIGPLAGWFFPGWTCGMSAIAAAGSVNAITLWEYWQ